MTAFNPGQSPPPVSTPILAMGQRLRAPASPRSGYRAQRLLHRDRTSEVEPLRVVDAQRADRVERRVVADELGQRRRPEPARDLHDGLDDEAVGRVVAQAADE